SIRSVQRNVGPGAGYHDHVVLDLEQILEVDAVLRLDRSGAGGEPGAERARPAAAVSAAQRGIARDLRDLRPVDDFHQARVEPEPRRRDDDLGHRAVVGSGTTGAASGTARGTTQLFFTRYA